MSGRGGDGGGLTRLTVNLVRESVDALNAAAEMAGDTRTDTVNRAIQLYAEVLRLDEGGIGYGRIHMRQQGVHTIHVDVNRPFLRFW